ncbi:MAG: long-chain-fatty-acid--CoA ligase, partial [Smithellaceae bacterium]|nr:long-chain-fatty-acid--CoA ligase [Smithellaceae bacterium]
DTVCVFEYDSHRYLECFFAIPMMGAVLHTQNWRLSPEQIVYTMNHAEDDVVIINTDFLPLFEAVKDQVKSVKKIILIDEDGVKPQTKLAIDAEYEDLLASSAAFYDFPDFDELTRATTFYTTGTTGDPKGVYFSHRQIVLHAQALITVTSAYDSIGRFNSSDVYMPLTPMFHVHAWGVPFAATMLGIKQVYAGKYEPAMLLKLILTEKVTFSHCVPTIIQMLVSTPVVKQFDLTKWKVVIGGARLPKGLAQAAMEMGIQIYGAYGMSETCPLVSMANIKPNMVGKTMIENVDTLIRTGLPAPFVYARIMGPDGKLLPHDGETTGELVLRAPWLTEGYYNEPDKTKDLWYGGWMHTGDVAYIDQEGYIQITDRIKDVIKTGGEWISSLELENLMSLHEAVAEAAAIGVPDPKWGERPVIVLTLKPDFKGKVTEEDFKQFMLKASEDGKIPKYGVPDRYMMVDEIPKSSVGKINKIALRKAYI